MMTTIPPSAPPQATSPTGLSVTFRVPEHVADDLTFTRTARGLSVTGTVYDGLSRLLVLWATTGPSGFLSLDPPVHAATLAATPDPHVCATGDNDPLARIRLDADRTTMLTTLTDTFDTTEQDMIRHAIHTSRTMIELGGLGGHAAPVSVL